MIVTILQGISGSGKSTFARTLSADVVSADNHFMVDGEYRFDPSRLPDAHAECLMTFLACLSSGRNVVVDNTNTTAVEVAPYYALAQAFGADVEIVRVACDPATAAKRTTHGVPEAAVYAMHRRLESFSGPPWWSIRTVAGSQ